MTLLDKVERLIALGIAADVVEAMARHELGIQRPGRQQPLPLVLDVQPKPVASVTVAVVPEPVFDAAQEVEQFGGDAQRIYDEGAPARAKRNAANKQALMTNKPTPKGTHRAVNANYAQVWDAVRKMPSPKGLIDMLKRAQGSRLLSDFVRVMQSEAHLTASYNDVRAWFEGSLLPSEKQMAAIANACNIPEGEAIEAVRRAAAVQTVLRSRMGMRSIQKKEV